MLPRDAGPGRQTGSEDSMFADAIERVGDFTRPVKFITRLYGEKAVMPGLATLFFVNDDGCAVTCRHVAQQIIQAQSVSSHYEAFRAACARVPAGSSRASDLKKLELSYKMKEGTPIQMKVKFDGCVSNFTGFDIRLHKELDIAIIRFKGYDRSLYRGHAVFVKDMSKVRPGDMLCRLGFPFPEFRDFRYDAQSDQIEWDSSAGRSSTPRFPIEGMFTRQIGDAEGRIFGIELSTPGLKGQSGGPLFTTDGLVCGMQSATKHLHLGFDMVGEKRVIQGREKIINNQPFLHVGHCVSADMIKEFLRREGVEYFEA